MTLEEAVALPGKKVQVAAADERTGELALLIVTLSECGAEQVAGRYVPKADHPVLMARFAALGAPLGRSDFHTNIVWLRHEDGGLEVYDETRRLLVADADRATLADGTVVERADIVRIVAFASSNYIHRGVSATLRSGQTVELVKEISSSAMGDPIYSRNELLFETSGWLPAIASDIAGWAHVSFEDRI